MHFATIKILKLFGYNKLATCISWPALNGTKGGQHCQIPLSSGVPRNFVWGVGFSTNSVEDRGQRERGSGGGSPLVRGSGVSCNLVQEISFQIVKFSQFFAL